MSLANIFENFLDWLEGPPTWSSFDQHRANRDGWGLFEEGPDLVLQKCGGAGKFEADHHAWRHVKVHAERGIDLHVKALEVLKYENHDEWRMVMEAAE